MKIEIDKVDPDSILTTESITAQVITIPIEATLDDITRIDIATTGTAHNDFTQPIETTANDITVTHHIIHITDHPHIEALQVIDSEIAVGHIQDHPTDCQGMNHIDKTIQQDKVKTTSQEEHENED